VIISVNGRLVREQEAVVSVYDHGFLYGMGVFETFRTYRGRPFLLQEHLARLEFACKQLGIVYEPDPDIINGEISGLLAANQLDDGYFRFTVTAGVQHLGLPVSSYERPTTVMYVKPLPGYDSPVYDNGKMLQLLRLRRSTPEGETRFKSLHYMNNILAKRELNSYPWAQDAEGLFLDHRGYVTEGIVSNVFFVKAGKVHTPSPATGLLNGITRQFVINMLRFEGCSVCEGWYFWNDLLEAEEVFITNSVQEIVPVTCLSDAEGRRHSVGDGKPGPLTRRLLESYRNRAWTCHGEGR